MVTHRPTPNTSPLALALALCVSTMGNLTAASANDAFADRIELTGSFVTVTAEDNYPATREPGDPTPGDASLWWSWTAPASGPCTFTTTTDNYVPYLSIYTGSSLASLALVVSNTGDQFEIFGRSVQVVVDASKGTKYVIAISSHDGGNGPGMLSIAQTRPPNVIIVTPTDGATVYAAEETLLRADAVDADGEVIKVEFFSNWQGAQRLLGTVTNPPFELKYAFVYSFSDGGPQNARIQARATDNNGVVTHSPGMDIRVSYPPPPNDDFTNRLAISGSFFTVAGNNLYATRETDDPIQGRGSLWWEWMTPTSGVFLLTAVAHESFFTPFLGIYSGGSLASLTPVGTNIGTSEQTHSARVAVNAVAGARYMLAVSAAGLGGDLRLCISPPDPPSTAGFEMITAQPLALINLTNAAKLRLWFRTGTGERWRVEASSNLLIWEAVSQDLPSHIRMDLETTNVRRRSVGVHDVVLYVVSPLYYRLAVVPPAQPSRAVDADPTNRSAE